jgi:hypothetical protein
VASTFNAQQAIPWISGNSALDTLTMHGELAAFKQGFPWAPRARRGASFFNGCETTVGSEQRALLGELPGIDAGTQEADQDEGARVQLHGAHDEVRMAGEDALAVLLGEHVQRLLAGAVALEVGEVGEVGGLDLPILQGVGMRATG